MVKKLKNEEDKCTCLICVCVYIQTYSQQNKEEILMKITVLISVTGHVVINGIYNNLPLLNLYSLCPQQVHQMV